jgi:hypothetical protein
MQTGSCLCEKVKYEIRGEIGRGVFCHCSRCRKANGSVVAFNAPVASDNFVVTAGENYLKSFDTPVVSRFFCSECGSQIMSRRAGAPEVIRLRLGTLDVPPTNGPVAHIYVDSKIDWFEIHDDAQQFSGPPSADFMKPPTR